MFQSQRRQGVVKFFNENKGFGFIVASDNSEEIFVHVTGIEDQIEKGDNVSFETASGQKGISAVRVKRD